MSKQPEGKAGTGADGGERPIVRMVDVTKRFGDEVILDHLDLDVPRGQKVAIIGSSGSGKSTILRITIALEGIDEGRVEIDGRSLFSMPAPGGAKGGKGGHHGSAGEVPADEAHKRKLRERVGIVFQHFNLFPHMTALRNITEAPVRVLGLSRDEAEERARELLERVGLSGKEGSHPAQLSGGQQQRVAIARALAMKPGIMLFDEVTSGLDPEWVGEVLNVLRDLAHEESMTMLIVTHQMHFAEDIADRVLFLDGGRIVEAGPPEQIFSAPEEARTREFLDTVLEA